MIVVEYKLTGIEALTRMQVVNAVKRALRRLGEYWHEAFAWKRFTPLAYSEYGFKTRKSWYDEKKKKWFGEALPLVFSGEAREQLLSESTKARIRVTRDSVSIPMPTKLNQYNPEGPKLPDEVRRVSRAELNILQENMVLWIEQELNNEVPAHLRNQGFLGGGTASVKMVRYRGPRNTTLPLNRPANSSANPVERRKAA